LDAGRVQFYYPRGNFEGGRRKVGGIEKGKRKREVPLLGRGRKRQRGTANKEKRGVPREKAGGGREASVKVALRGIVGTGEQFKRWSS